MHKLRLSSVTTRLGGAIAVFVLFACREGISETGSDQDCMPVTILGFQASSGQWGPGAYELTIKDADVDVRCSFTLDAGATGVVSKCNPRGTFSPVRSEGCKEVVGDAASGGDCVSTAPFDLVEYRRDGAPLSELDYRLLRDGAELAAGRVPTANACPGQTCACQKAVVDVATP